MAGESIAEATVTLRGDGAQLEGDVTRVVGNIGKAIAGLAIAKGAFDFVKEGVQRLGEMEVTAARTNAVIKSTGGIANVTASSIENFGHKIQDTIGVQGDLVQSGENVLLKYTDIRNEVGKGNDIFNQARDAMVDLSVATGKDMAGAATILGRALETPEKAMGALKKAGVNLTQQQQDSIATFVALGETVEAQKVILEAVNDTVGGSAEAFGETLPAKMAVAQQKFADMRAEIASAFLPAIEFGADAVGFLSDKIQELPGPLSAAVVGTIGLAAGVGAVAGPLNELVDFGGSAVDFLKRFKPEADAAAAGADAIAAGSTAAGSATQVLGSSMAGTVGFAAAATAGVALLVGGLGLLISQTNQSGISSEALANTLKGLTPQETTDALKAYVGTVETTTTAFQNMHEKWAPLSHDANDNAAAVLLHDRTLRAFNIVAGDNVNKATAMRDEWAQHPAVLQRAGITLGELDGIIAANSTALAENSGYVNLSKQAATDWAAQMVAAAPTLQNIKAATEAWNATVASGIGPMLESTNASVNYQAAVDQLTAAFLADTTNMDLNEQSGRNVAVALENVTITTLKTVETQIAAAEASGHHAQAMDIASFAAAQMATDILASGAAAGQSTGEVELMIASVLRIPPEAVTTILQNAPDAQSAVEQFIMYFLSHNGDSIDTSINVHENTFRTVYYNTVGAMWAGNQEGANQGYYYAHGGIAGAAKGMITRGPALRIIGEAGPEAVVPLGNTATNRSDRSKVMSAAGLASGGWSDERVVSMLAATNRLLAQVIANQQVGGHRPGPSRAIVGGRR